MPEVGELMAECVHEARVFQRLAGLDVPKTNLDRAIRIANTVSSLDVGSFRFENTILETKPRTDPQSILFQTAQKLLLRTAVQSAPPPEQQCRDRAGFRQRQERTAKLFLPRMESIESLPLFPLSDVVLLPGVSVPLRLFEPRYLQMVRAVLDGPAQIGMVTVRPDSLAEMAADPPIFSIGCVGQVSHAQEQADGTFQILLLGTRRFRIVQEEERSGDRLYRSARVDLLEDEPPTSPEAIASVEQERQDLFLLLERFVRRLGRGESVEHLHSRFEGLEPAHLINALTQSIALESVERQQLLEANSILSRFQIMCDLLRFRLAEVGGGTSGSVH